MYYRIFIVFKGVEVKQKKGRDYKPTRQWTDEDRIAKKRLSGYVKKAIGNGEFDDDKIIASTDDKGEKK